MVTIAVDAMSGDHGYAVIVPAVLKVLSSHPDLNIILVGQEGLLRGTFADKLKAYESRISIQHAEEVVQMDEAPSVALRGKKDSSMRVAINLVRDKQADACVSAGNTGALMAMSRFVLRMIDGIDRPAIISALPTIHDGRVYMLDLGANVDCNADHLLQFAVMGNVLVKVLEGIERPRVSLLSNGAEAIKGNDVVKLASDLISKHDEINYLGYCEGNDIFSGQMDLVVADGFVGNVALKTIEGTAKLVGEHLKSAFKSSLFGRVAGLLAMSSLNKLKRTIDPGRYNGATLLGLQGVVIKSHGNANVDAFANALKYAKQEAEAKLIDNLSEQVQQLL